MIPRISTANRAHVPASSDAIEALWDSVSAVADMTGWAGIPQDRLPAGVEIATIEGIAGKVVISMAGHPLISVAGQNPRSMEITVEFESPEAIAKISSLVAHIDAVHAAWSRDEKQRLADEKAAGRIRAEAALMALSL